MRVITLGTGAGRPSLTRNGSATALEYEGDVLLFDCGEATQHQLMRTPLKWGKLRIIFIGHLHGDHVNGLPGLLGTLSMSERHEPLKVFGPPGIKKYLEVHRECQSLWVNFPLEVEEIRGEGVLYETTRYQVRTIRLRHVIECWGYRFEEKDRPGHLDVVKAAELGIPDGPERGRLVRGETITLANGRQVQPRECVGPPVPGRFLSYCCDTMPCEAAVRLSENADLVIHEATFDQAMGAEANAWGHSTTADAARTAKEAGARRLLMTHISQRYTDSQVLLREAGEIFPEVLLAEDLAIYDL